MIFHQIPSAIFHFQPYRFNPLRLCPLSVLTADQSLSIQSVLCPRWLITMAEDCLQCHTEMPDSKPHTVKSDRRVWKGMSCCAKSCLAYYRKMFNICVVIHTKCNSFIIAALCGATLVSGLSPRLPAGCSGHCLLYCRLWVSPMRERDSVCVCVFAERVWWMGISATPTGQG